jgi:hypothetical protein
MFTAVLMVTIVGCGPSHKASTSTGASASRGSDVITAEELAHPSISSVDALEAVRRLRPRFLAVRGTVSMRVADAGSVHVSVDGGPLVTVSYLSRMRPSEIAEIRFLNANDAAQRFGTNAGSGSVLLIKSR